MLDDVKKHLQKTLKLIDGLIGVIITDRDGVPLIKVADEEALDLSLRPSFLTPFTMAADHASKLGIGQNNLIIAIYSSYQVVQLNHAPLVVTVFGKSESNTGMLIDVGEAVKPLVGQLAPVVDV